MTTVMAGTLVDDKGTRDLAAAYDGEGQEQVGSNKGIRHPTEKTTSFLVGIMYIFCCEYEMLFLEGVVQFLCVRVLLTKEKVVHTTLCTTYIEKQQPKTPSTLCFLWRMF
jgi:hypothetical protein